MPQRRTKKEKVRAKARLVAPQIQFSESSQVISTKPAKEVSTDKLVNFFPYSVSLIYRDLLKTALVTMFVVVLLFGISQTLS